MKMLPSPIAFALVAMLALPAMAQDTPEKFRPLLGTYENADNKRPTKWTITSFDEAGAAKIEYFYQGRKIENISATASEAVEGGKKILKLSVSGSGSMSSVAWDLSCIDVPTCKILPGTVKAGGRPVEIKVYRE